MKAVRYEAPGDFAVTDVPMPPVGPRTAWRDSLVGAPTQGNGRPPPRLLRRARQRRSPAGLRGGRPRTRHSGVYRTRGVRHARIGDPESASWRERIGDGCRADGTTAGSVDTLASDPTAHKVIIAVGSRLR